MNVSGRDPGDALCHDIRRRREILMGPLGPDEGILVYGLSGHAADLLYLTGYAPVFGAACLLLHPGREAQLWVPFSWDVERARRVTALTVSAADQMARDAGRAAIASGIRRLHLASAGDLPASFGEALRDAAPTLDVRPLSPRIDCLRRCKTPTEVQILREACRMTEAGFDAVVHQARRGLRELDIAAVAEYAMRRAGAEAFGWPAVVASGPNAGIPVAFSSARELGPQDLVTVDLGIVYRGYRSDLTRSFVVGSPTPGQQRVYDAVRHAFDAATTAARPGVPVRRLHEVVSERIAAQGYPGSFDVRAGHGIGLESSQEWPDVEREEASLEPGMTLCLEPGVYLGEAGGVRIEEEVLITETGCELLSKGPQGLTVL